MTGHRRIRRRSSGILATDDGDAFLLLDLRSSTYLTLNRTGGLLWEAIADPVDTGQLVAMCVERFGASEAEAEAAVDAFVDALAARGLLEPPA